MPQCRRDQTTFARFLLAVVVVESVLVIIAMTWEHKTAEYLAEEKRLKRRWKRQVNQEINESSLKGHANKGIIIDKNFNLEKRLSEELPPAKKTTEMRSSALSDFQENKAEGHFNNNRLKVQGQRNDDSQHGSEDVPVISFVIRSHDQNAGKGSVLLNVLTNQEDRFLKSKFREERRNLRGSML